ncbi:hypothetical protein B0H10DRAFT_1953741 [Mycena sp. CBHHK59/15]|nr:hypothetical protein B0H10DRAFT_1953741 [Mycena sp. CBHHK59/15]
MRRELLADVQMTAGMRALEFADRPARQKSTALVGVVVRRRISQRGAAHPDAQIEMAGLDTRSSRFAFTRRYPVLDRYQGLPRAFHFVYLPEKQMTARTRPGSAQSSVTTLELYRAESHKNRYINGGVCRGLIEWRTKKPLHRHLSGIRRYHNGQALASSRSRVGRHKSEKRNLDRCAGSAVGVDTIRILFEVRETKIRGWRAVGVISYIRKPVTGWWANRDAGQAPNSRKSAEDVTDAPRVVKTPLLGEIANGGHYREDVTDKPLGRLQLGKIQKTRWGANLCVAEE